EVGKGSTFTVTLPFAMCASSTTVAQPHTEIHELHCLVVGDQASLAADVSAYLSADGAIVKQVPDLAGARSWTRAHSPHPTVWVVDMGASIATVREILDARPFGVALSKVALVVIGRGRRRVIRADSAGVISVDGNALKRRTLCKAVAVAAGRADADTAAVTGKQRIVVEQPPTREAAIRARRLILLAEDDEMNQTVIRQQLQLLGVSVEVAQHGAEALRLWERGEFALLFTDLHMPEMDGYALTTAIREREHGRSHIPIVALTANALADEALRCRQVGMDDYLSKPATLRELAATLQRWLPTAGHSNTTTGPQPAPLDKAILEVLVGGDARVVNDLLLQFEATAAPHARQLSAACADERTGDAAAIAHKLKSSARAVGALQLGELCAAIELAGMGGRESELQTLLPRFETEMRAVQAYIAALPAADAMLEKNSRGETDARESSRESRYRQDTVAR
ncbi:MAG TPA: response regulator, partial [Steroidobacteraceae bacterium]